MLDRIKSFFSEAQNYDYTVISGGSDNKISEVAENRITPTDNSNVTSLAGKVTIIPDFLLKLASIISSVFSKQIKGEKISPEEILKNPIEYLPKLTEEDLKKTDILEATVSAINKISLPLENKKLILTVISKLQEKDLTQEIRNAIPDMVLDFSPQELKENKKLILTVVSKLQEEGLTKILKNLTDKTFIPHIEKAILNIAFVTKASQESNLPGARVGVPKLEMKSMIKLINAIEGTDLARHSFFRHYVDALYSIPEKHAEELEKIIKDPESKNALIKLLNKYSDEGERSIKRYITFIPEEGPITDLTWKAPPTAKS